MEPSCLNPNKWKGPVGMQLGGDLYKAEFASDDDFDESCTDLYNEIIRVIDEHGIQVTPVSSGTTSTTSGSSCRGGGGSGGGSRHVGGGGSGGGSRRTNQSTTSHTHLGGGNRNRQRSARGQTVSTDVCIVMFNSI